MKQLEKKMRIAICSGINWKCGNTQVINSNGVIIVLLHGNEIAKIGNGKMVVSLGGYDTTTTKSRLRALGANVTCKNAITYINGVQVTNKKEWIIL